MTEASSYLPQTRSTTFLLILNKYIFTFLCYIHYVNILKVIKEANLVPVRHSEEEEKEGEGLVSCQWLLHKNKLKSPNAAVRIWHVRRRSEWRRRLTENLFHRNDYSEQEGAGHGGRGDEVDTKQNPSKLLLTTLCLSVDQTVAQDHLCHRLHKKSIYMICGYKHEFHFL